MPLKHAGDALCFYRPGAWFFRRLCLYRYSAHIYFLGAAENVGSVESVLADGVGIVSGALYVSPYGLWPQAIGDGGQSGGGAVIGYRYRADDSVVAYFVGWSGRTGGGVVGVENVSFHSHRAFHDLCLT